MAKYKLGSNMRGARADQKVPGVLVQDVKLLTGKLSGSAVAKPTRSTAVGVLAHDARDRSGQRNPRHDDHQKEMAGYVAALRVKPKVSPR